MDSTQYKGQRIDLARDVVGEGEVFPDFTGVDTGLEERKLSDFRGQKVILNIFPSVDTSVCASSVRRFNYEAVSLENTAVINISLDLPFAHARFEEKEGIANVISLSLYRTPGFGEDTGLRMENGPFQGLMARAVYALDEKGEVLYRELVEDISQEPKYHRALKAVM